MKTILAVVAILGVAGLTMALSAPPKKTVFQTTYEEAMKSSECWAEVKQGLFPKRYKVDYIRRVGRSYAITSEGQSILVPADSTVVTGCSVR